MRQYRARQKQLKTDVKEAEINDYITDAIKTPKVRQEILAFKLAIASANKTAEEAFTSTGRHANEIIKEQSVY